VFFLGKQIVDIANVVNTLSSSTQNSLQALHKAFGAYFIFT
jgi:hypothetical protein